MPTLPLRANGWFVLTSALPTRETRYHREDEQAALPQALPAGTLVLCLEDRHKNVGAHGEYGHSQRLIPVPGVAPFDNPNGRDERMLIDQARIVWRRWCDREATVQHLKRFDEPTPVLATTPVPVREATAEDVQPLFDQVQAARERALDTHRYQHLEHYNHDVTAVIHGLSSPEQARLQHRTSASPRHRWESTGLDSLRFAVRQAREHQNHEWVPSFPATPHSRAGIGPVNPDMDAATLLARHRSTVVWMDRIGPVAAHGWIEEAVITASSCGGVVHAAMKEADRTLERLPALDKPMWSYAEQEQRDRLINRTTQALKPWFQEHLAMTLEQDDGRTVAATTLYQADEPATNPWNQEHAHRFEHELLPVIVEVLLWDRKVEMDLQATMRAQPVSGTARTFRSIART